MRSLLIRLYLLYIFTSCVILSFEYIPYRVTPVISFLFTVVSFATQSFLVVKASLLLFSLPFIIIGLKNYFRSSTYTLSRSLPALCFASWFIGLFVALINSVNLVDALSNFSFLLLAPISYCAFLFKPELLWVFCLYSVSLLFSALSSYVSAGVLLSNLGSTIFYLNSSFIAWLLLYTIPFGVNPLLLLRRSFPSFFRFPPSAPPTVWIADALLIFVCLPVALSYISFTSILLLSLLLLLLLRRRIPLGFMAFIASVCVSLLFILFLSESLPFLLSLISAESESDIRLEKLPSLLSDLRIFGNGLGAPFVSLDGRGKSYGFELFYINIIHKLGVFSLPILLLYTSLACKSLYNLFVRSSSLGFRDYFSSSSIIFLVTGLFNPTLGSFYASFLVFVSFSHLDLC